MPTIIPGELQVVDPQIDADQGNTPVKDEKFFPIGAIVFFICLVLLSLIFWYGIYILMIERT